MIEKIVELTLSNGEKIKINHSFDSKLSKDEELQKVFEYINGSDFTYQEISNDTTIAINVNHIVTIRVYEDVEDDYSEYLQELTK